MRPAVLIEVDGESEAAIVVGLLHQAGIPAWSARAGLRGRRWLDWRLPLLSRAGTAFGPHSVLVHEQDLAAAREVLAAPVEPPMDGDTAEAGANVQLTIAANAIEAEMICGLLRDCAIPAHFRATSRNSAWSGGTDMLASQVVMVAERDLEAARRVLASDFEDPPPS